MAKGKKTGGRVVGSKNKATLERKLVEEDMRQRVLRGADNLLNAKFNLANGCSFLYCITTNKKGERSKPRLIKDQETIEAYLNDELNDGGEDYYYITTEKPSGIDIENLLDRTFGKPTQKTEVGVDVKISFVEFIKYLNANPYNPIDDRGRTLGEDERQEVADESSLLDQG